MELIDVTKKDKEYAGSYGLSLHLDKECLEKLGIDKLPDIGDHMVLICRAKVSDLHESESNKSMGIQIIEMAIKKNDEKKVDAAKKIYGDKY